MVALLCMVTRPVAAESIVLGGIEDHPANSSFFEGAGDYNNLMFSMAGNISVIAPSANPQALSPGIVNESGTIFWDNHSYDGNDYNFGYCVSGTGNCRVANLPAASYDYVAMSGRGATQ